MTAREAVTWQIISLHICPRESLIVRRRIRMQPDDTRSRPYCISMSSCTMCHKSLSWHNDRCIVTMETNALTTWWVVYTWHYWFWYDPWLRERHHWMQTAILILTAFRGIKCHINGSRFVFLEMVIVDGLRCNYGFSRGRDTHQPRHCVAWYLALCKLTFLVFDIWVFQRKKNTEKYYYRCFNQITVVGIETTLLLL